jgi:phage gp36-like protein
MPFLTTDDYNDHIKPEILAKLTEGSEVIRTNMELKVQEEISMALRVRYDVPNIFNKAGAARNQLLVAFMVDMVIYRLAKRLNPGQISETIKESYQNAKTDLDRIASGNYEIDLPLAGDSNDDGVDDKNVLQWGGLPPRNPYF